MKTSSFFLQIVFCMALLAPATQAQEITPPDRAHRQGMSYEEYAKYRERMRQRMEKMQADEHRQSKEKSDSPQDQIESRPHHSAYGQGYRSRNMEDQADAGRDSRPERPQRIERFDRGGMMRR